VINCLTHINGNSGDQTVLCTFHVDMFNRPQKLITINVGIQMVMCLNTIKPLTNNIDTTDLILIKYISCIFYYPETRLQLFSF
jgi:hypothetical protein